MIKKPNQSWLRAMNAAIQFFVLALSNLLSSGPLSSNEISSNLQATKDCEQRLRTDFRLQAMISLRTIKSGLRYGRDRIVYKNGDIFVGDF